MRSRVSSWEQEMAVYLACYLKSRFVPDKLAPLSFERDLIAFKPSKVGDVETDILESYAASRGLCQ